MRPSVCLALAALAATSTSASAPRKSKNTRSPVSSLPGLHPPTPATKTSSGFIDVGNGTHLFYLLVESQSAPATDPLVWWTNGGPGASSLVGAFLENGPYLLTGGGGGSKFDLMSNPYSWNKEANMLYVEFPAGIGFSYCEASSAKGGTCDQSRGDCSPCLASDTSVVDGNLAVIRALLLGDGSSPALFPELAANPVFLAGESYAGVYLPTLAQAILHDEPKVDLRGVWVTDPCTDNAAQSGYLDIGVRFSCDKGLITPELRDTLLAKPCTTGTTQVGDLVRGNSTAACRAAWRLYDIATAGVGDAVHPTAINGLPMYAEESTRI